jgi:hypothetical protein
MPVNYQQIQAQIKVLGLQVQSQRDLLEQARLEANLLLEESAGDPLGLKNRLDLALEKYPALRCAAPAWEQLDQAYPLPELKPPVVFLAADGSQINPDRHARVEYAVVNAGVFRMSYGLQETPQMVVRSQLLYPDPTDSSLSPLNEMYVALMRDLNERSMLADLALTEELPVIALTDGPLELFCELKESSEFTRMFQEYLLALLQLAGKGRIAAGYVDKPGAVLVVRLLELMLLQDNELQLAGRRRPFPGVTDTHLFINRLKPGERSAIFGLQSISASLYRETSHKLALNFFYLNVGLPNRSALARVDFPAWVAEQPDQVNQLHAALVQQCRLMGTTPYPYVLARAHEIAEIKIEERSQVEEMIIGEIQRQGAAVGNISSKQAIKNVTGSRTRKR